MAKAPPFYGTAVVWTVKEEPAVGGEPPVLSRLDWWWWRWWWWLEGGLRFTHHIECEKEGECNHSRVSALRGNAGEKREGTDGKSKMTGWLRARHTGLECHYQFKQSCFLTFIYSCRRYRLLTCFFFLMKWSRMATYKLSFKKKNIHQAINGAFGSLFSLNLEWVRRTQMKSISPLDGFGKCCDAIAGQHRNRAVSKCCFSFFLSVVCLYFTLFSRPSHLFVCDKKKMSHRYMK